MQPLDLQRPEQRLAAGVVPSVATPAHRGRDAVLLEHVAEVVAGAQGEFNRSLQHILTGGVDESEEVKVGSITEAQATFAWQAAGAASRRAMAVLEGDRTRAYQRGHASDRWRVASCRQPLVPTMRRYASIRSCAISHRAHRTVSCLCRALAKCAGTCPQRRRSRDRRETRSVAIDDLARTAAQCCNAWRRP